MRASFDLQPDQLIGGAFRVVRRLSEGGMGVVYIAEQLSTGRLRALKLMRLSTAGEDDVQRFEREARVGALIHSEHIVDVVAAGIDTETNCPWLAMELLEGSDLSSYVQGKRQLSIQEMSFILQQIAAGLSAAHDVRVVHRDIKPDNVFLARSSTAPSGYVVKILDFGIAKLLDASSHSTKTIGSPFWMAPEQTNTRPELSCATDVWPLALMAFYMLTGQYYWLSAGEARFELAAFLRELLIEPLPKASVRAAELHAPALPEWFDDWFAGCLTREVEQRYPDARRAWNAFEAGLRSSGIGSPSLPYRGAFASESNVEADTVVNSEPPGPPAQTGKTPLEVASSKSSASSAINEKGTRPRAWIVLGLIGVAMAGAAAWFALQPPASSDEATVAPPPEVSEPNRGDRSEPSPKSERAVSEPPVVAPPPAAPSAAAPTPTGVAPLGPRSAPKPSRPKQGRPEQKRPEPTKPTPPAAPEKQADPDSQLPVLL